MHKQAWRFLLASLPLSRIKDAPGAARGLSGNTGRNPASGDLPNPGACHLTTSLFKRYEPEDEGDGSMIVVE